KVTGSIELQAGKVEIDGNDKAGEVTLSFVYPDFESGASITATLIGKLEGDELKGVIDYQTFGSGEWKGRRAQDQEQNPRRNEANLGAERRTFGSRPLRDIGFRVCVRS